MKSESETVAGAAEEQAAELNEVSTRASDLQRYAAPLRDILEDFETDGVRVLLVVQQRPD